MACLEALKQLEYPLDRIVHAEVWATDTISADLPPMVDFKEKADKIIKERYGITVEHISAIREGRLSFERQFYTIRQRKCGGTAIYGFPVRIGQWCVSKFKTNILNTLHRDSSTNIVQYLGIAADKPERIERHKSKPRIILPLVDIGWGEAQCREWCEENDLLSPIYTDSARGGCWFCHSQSVEQLRLLRKKYPDLWSILLKWDLNSPVPFKQNGRTVHDFDRRFQLEEADEIPIDKTFRWKMIN